MPRAPLVARMTALGVAQRAAIDCARRNLDLANRLRPAYLAALDETGLAELEADIVRRHEEDEMLTGLVSLVEAWAAEGFPV